MGSMDPTSLYIKSSLLIGEGKIGKMMKSNQQK